MNRSLVKSPWGMSCDIYLMELQYFLIFLWPDAHGSLMTFIQPWLQNFLLLAPCTFLIVLFCYNYFSSVCSCTVCLSIHPFASIFTFKILNDTLCVNYWFFQNTPAYTDPSMKWPASFLRFFKCLLRKQRSLEPSFHFMHAHIHMNAYIL